MSDVPLVIQLQQLAADPDEDIVKLLNLTLVIATKLGLSDMRDWVIHELNGYDSDLPSYRIVMSRLFFQDAFGRHTPAIIPSNADLSDSITNIKLRDPVQGIWESFKTGNGCMILYHPQQADYLREIFRCSYIPVASIPQQQLSGIVSFIRTKILDWALGLELSGILGQGFQFTIKEKGIAVSHQTFHIGNMQGVAGNVSGGAINQQNTMTVQAANFESLANNLRQHGIGDDDIRTLQEAISQDPAPDQSGHFGGKVSAWLGSMITKAATGTIGLAVGVAGTVLTDAIKGYYGI